MKSKKEQIEEKLKENARKISIKEGAAASVMSGAGDNFVTPFAVEISKNIPGQSIFLGLISSLPSIISPIAQNIGSKLIETRSRKEIVVRYVKLQAITWIPIALLAILFWKNLFQNYLAYALLFFYGLYAIFGGLSGPAYFSWMGDIVPENQRGAYFSKRNRVTGTVALISFLIAGYMLDIFKTRGFVFIGFAILFSIASIFRLISYSKFKQQYSPRFKLGKEYYFSFWAFLKKYTNFTKFVIFEGVFHFGFMIGSPFFTVYMLKELQFDYITYTIVVMSGTLFYLALTPLAGKMSDKYGNKLLLYIGGVAYGISALTWIIFTSPVYLIFVTQVISGLGTAAFTIGTSNYIYDAVTPQRRGICVAYMNTLVGLGVLLGSLVGGLIINSLTLPWMNIFLWVFLITAILRTGITIAFMPYIKEVRPVKRLKIANITFSSMNPLRLLQWPMFWFRTTIRRYYS